MIHLISRQKKILNFFFSNLFETIPWCSAIIKATISTGGQIVARTGSLSSGIAMWSIEKKTYKVRLLRVLYNFHLFYINTIFISLIYLSLIIFLFFIIQYITYSIICTINFKLLISFPHIIFAIWVH